MIQIGPIDHFFTSKQIRRMIFVWGVTTALYGNCLYVFTMRNNDSTSLSDFPTIERAFGPITWHYPMFFIASSVCKYETE